MASEDINQEEIERKNLKDKLRRLLLEKVNVYYLYFLLEEHKNYYIFLTSFGIKIQMNSKI
jgi:hypothetical protein